MNSIELHPNPSNCFSCPHPKYAQCCDSLTLSWSSKQKRTLSITGAWKCRESPTCCRGGRTIAEGKAFQTKGLRYLRGAQLYERWNWPRYQKIRGQDLGMEWYTLTQNSSHKFNRQLKMDLFHPSGYQVEYLYTCDAAGDVLESILH